MILDRVISWVSGVINRMLNQSNVKQALNVDIAMSETMISAIRMWSMMYADDLSWMAETRYTGAIAGTSEADRSTNFKSMNLPAAIASEIARAVTIEMQVSLTGSERAKFLQSQYDLIAPKMRQMVEYAVAKGGMVFKPYVHGDQILVDFVQADQFFPIAFDVNGNLTSCVFSDQRIIGKWYYTRLESHTMDGDKCVIKNRAFRSETRGEIGQEVELTSVDVWSDLTPEAEIQNVKRPLFAYFRYPSANTVDPASPLGVSCYARAPELIKQANVLWTDLLWEFESGQRALYVDVLAFGKDAKGKPVLPHKRLYKTLESGSAEGDFFEEWSPTFREQNILNGIEAVLKKTEFTCGLAYGTISDPNTIEKTATEIVSSKQRSYATITDTQKALKHALEDLFVAMDLWATLAGIAPKGTYSTKFEFDDSVVVDKDTQFMSDMKMVNAGMMTKVEFRMRNLGEDEATAKQKIAEADAEQMASAEAMAAVAPAPTFGA